MFTTGRIIFASIFIIVFVGGMIWAYAKDASQQKEYFKNTGIILVVIISILAGFRALLYFS